MSWLDTDGREKEHALSVLEISGLFHDAGHGPGSHLFESFMASRGIHFDHEQMSCEMLEHAIDENIQY